MIITSINTDAEITTVFVKHSNNKGKEVYFYDYVNNNDYSHIMSLKNDIPVIIFDRYCRLTDKQVISLTKRNVVLIEPVIDHRNGFIYHPYWLNLSMPSFDEFENKKYSCVYSGNLFENNILNNKLFGFITNFCNKTDDSYKINISAKLTSPQISSLEEIKSIDIDFNNVCYDKQKTTIITSNNKGYIPDIRDMLKHGTLPLLFNDSYFLYGMFYPFIIHTYNDLRYYINLYDSIGYGLVEDVIDNIKKSMPTMEMNVFVDNMISIFKKM